MIGGVTWVNDSKGTNVGATEAALRGLGGDRNVLLIAGGQGKGADFAALRDAVSVHCRRLLLIGEAAAELQDQSSRGWRPSARASSLEQAVALAAGEARPGDCVLLSPACASFDMFSGYAEGGATVFSDLARQLEGGVR